MHTNMCPRPVATERRQEQRKRPLSLVYVELSSANGGMLRDISELGFAMRAMMPLRVGEVTPFRFALDESTRLEGSCKVLWVEDDGRVAGLLFTKGEERLRTQVREWLGEKRDSAPASASAPVVVDSQSSTMEELREELRAVVPRPELQVREEVTPTVVHAEAHQKEATHEAELVVAPEAQSELLPALNLSTVTPGPEAVSVLEPLPPLEMLPVLEELENSSEATGTAPWISRAMMALAMRMMVVLALVAVAVVYHRPLGNSIIWLGQKIAGEESPEVTPAPKSEIIPPNPGNTGNGENSNSGAAIASAPAVVPEKGHTDGEAAPEKKIAEVPTVTENPAPLAAKSPTRLSPVPLPTTNRSTTFSTPGTMPGDAGQQEYVLAEEVLKNKNTEAGLPEAVRLLWIAVEKGNTNAEVALAELYRVGHGVARNCDQTRILLTAAARKGSAEAQRHLNQFLAEGCE